MHIILGGTGHVGSAVTAELLGREEAVTIVTQNASKATHWIERGATVAECNVNDSDALRAIFRTGRRAFLLNPPGSVGGDVDREERATIAAILLALDGSGLEKVVAESTYGAQPGDQIGDLGTLHDLEAGLAAQPIPAAVNRAAYYMSNLDMLLDAARSGAIPTMFPADLGIPMVAPADLGRAAVERLVSPVEDAGVRYIEGPARYSFADVAEAFGSALGRRVEVQQIPREGWIDAFKRQGFSDAAARSYAGMTAVAVDGGAAEPENPTRGVVTLREYVAELVGR